MKKTVILLIAAIIAVTAAACTEAELDAPVGMKLISDEAADYYLYVPSTWVVAQQEGLTSAYVSVSDPSNVSCARYTVKNTDIFALDTSAESSASPAVQYARNYWTGYQSDLAAALPGYMEIGEPAVAYLDGNEAVVYTYAATLSGVEYKFSAVVCVIEYQVYILTYTATAEAYQNNAESFTSIIDNFKFQKGLFE